MSTIVPPKKLTVAERFILDRNAEDERRTPEHVILKRCPCCESDQIYLCSDANNIQKNQARCRVCWMTGPVFAWNRRPGD